MGALVLTPGRVALLAVATVAAAGCYSPSVDSCTVECGAGGACAAGLECRADGFCHTSESEGLCTEADAAAVADGAHDAPDPGDGATPDARGDAASGLMLVVNIDGRGRVVSEPLGIDCMDTCVQSYPAGTSVSLAAIKNHPLYDFSEWLGECTGGSQLCEFTLEQATSVTAVFTQ